MSTANRLETSATAAAPTWEDYCEALEAFVQREGHCRPPYRGTVDGLRLYDWAARQRAHAERLTLPQRHRLSRIPGWVWNVSEWHWQEGVRHLRAYAEREGHTRVPKRHIESGYRLGAWVARTRARAGALNPDQRDVLEAIPGWTWSSRLPRWDAKYQALLEFVHREGHAQVPGLHVEGDVELGRWVARQRMAYRRGTLDATRSDRLERVRGWMWSGRAHHDPNA